MLDRLIDIQKIESVGEFIDGGKKFVILVHRNPDGDAVGSATALALFLRAMGKTATVIVPNAFPDFLAWLPTAMESIVYESAKEDAVAALSAADVLFCLDFNALSRLGELGEVVAGLSTPRLLVDHHLHPDEGFAVAISEPAACSTAELVFRLIYRLNSGALTRDIAECIYTGMMTDTGSFAYASNRKDIYIIISHLIAAGIDKDLIYRKVFYNYSTNRMKLLGFMMYDKLRVYPAYNSALITLTYKEMRRFSVAKGDTEGLVNMPLQIKGIRFVCFLREEVPGKINVSLRSVDDFPCNSVAAEFFAGGGHKNASGGEVYGTMEYAVERYRTALSKYKQLLTE